MKKTDKIALMILIFSGLNWGIWSIFEFNIIDYIFGEMWIDQVIYFIMGAAAVYALFTWKQLYNCWLKKS